MVLLDTLYKNMQYGELKDLAIGGSRCGDGITEEGRDQILTHLNLGLTDLHSRFRLRQYSAIFQVQSNRTKYILDPKYAHGVSNTEAKYIVDMGSRLNEAVIKIESVRNNIDQDLKLNDNQDPCSFFTPEYNILEVPRNIAQLTKDILKVGYRAGHPLLTSEANYDPLTTQIHIPPAFTRALLLFVASRVHNPVGITQDAQSQGDSYFAKYMQAVADLHNEGEEIDNLDELPKFHQKGFC